MGFLIQSIVLFSLVLVATAGKANLIEAIHKECAAESKIDDSYLEKANKGEFIDDVTFNKYLLCCSRKKGILVESFEISEEAVRKGLETQLKDETKVNAIIKKCVVKAETILETACSMHKCYLDQTDVKFDQLIKEHADLHKECVAQSHVEDAVIEKAKKNEVVDDDKFKQYLLCVYTKNGLIKESFEIATDVAKKGLLTKIKDEAKVDQILNKCVIDKKLETAARTVFVMAKCLFENVEDFKFVYKF